MLQNIFVSNKCCSFECSINQTILKIYAQKILSGCFQHC